MYNSVHIADAFPICNRLKQCNALHSLLLVLLTNMLSGKVETEWSCKG